MPRAMHKKGFATKQTPSTPKKTRKLGYTGKVKSLHPRFGYNPNQTLALMKLNIFGIR